MTNIAYVAPSPPSPSLPSSLPPPTSRSGVFAGDVRNVMGSAPQSSSARSKDLAQLLSAAGNSQEALERAKERLSMLQASSGALQVALNNTNSCRQAHL